MKSNENAEQYSKEHFIADKNSLYARIRLYYAVYEHLRRIVRSYDIAAEVYYCEQERMKSGRSSNVFISVLAIIYACGVCEAPSFEHVFELCSQCVEALPNVNVLYMLGLCWLYGYGTRRDVLEAVKCFYECADQGSVDALQRLSECEKAHGVDYSGVFYHFERLAAAGSSTAYFNYAYCLFTGLGCNSDHYKAYKSFKKDATAGNGDAAAFLGRCCEYGHHKNPHYETAFKCYKTAVYHESAYGAFCLGWCYEVGLGTLQNVERAVRLYKLAAGDVYLLILACRGYSGTGIERNVQEARSNALIDNFFMNQRSADAVCRLTELRAHSYLNRCQISEDYIYRAALGGDVTNQFRCARRCFEAQNWANMFSWLWVALFGERNDALCDIYYYIQEAAQPQRAQEYIVRCHEALLQLCMETRSEARAGAIAQGVDKCKRRFAEMLNGYG